MPEHLIIGKSGEDLAAVYIEQKGYVILERNWRSRRNEVDIIASENKVLHFIEVKTRTSFNHGMPEQKAVGNKLKHLKDAAEAYLFQHPEWKMIQFDILSINIRSDGTPTYFFIEDVF